MTAGGALALLERALRGRDDAFFALLEEAAENAAATARLLREFLHGYPETAQMLDQINECEQVGDRITHAIVQRLNREVATPIDREDIWSLASALDDVVDFIHEAAAYLSLYSAEASMTQADAMANVLVDATGELAEAVHKAVRFEAIKDHTIAVHRLENEGDRLVRRAIASLFDVDRIDPMVVIRWKDIFERLEDAIDSTERAAFLLESIVIKNI
jgi:uncharacterized protein